MVQLIPISKINQPSIRDIGKCSNFPDIVIRVQDLLTRVTGNYNKTFYQIKEAGGIHNLPEYKGKEIMLSFVMTDKLIPTINEWKATKIIQIVQPDSYSTFDCETYEGEPETSLDNIRKSLILTAKLLKLCPGYKVIGQVKGCTRWQVIQHTLALRRLGITDFLFHTSDYFRHGDKNMIQRARMYAKTIRPYAKKLYLYGFSDQDRLIQFSFADAYISMAYFSMALKGYKLYGTKKSRYNRLDYKQVSCQNLRQMRKNIFHINRQQKLIIGGECPWEAAQEEQGFGILEPQAPTLVT
jgi:hypothetical protein